MKKTLHVLTLALAMSCVSFAAMAQEAASAAASAPAEAWKYKTKKLSREQVDALLSKPKHLVILDVRRPDEVAKIGGFPAYLSVQVSDLSKELDFIPRDRIILTVSNRAHRAGAVGDELSHKGYKVAGAIGVEDYREAGGTILIIQPPAPRASQ